MKTEFGSIGTRYPAQLMNEILLVLRVFFRLPHLPRPQDI